jgi:hypothetical protein
MQARALIFFFSLFSVFGFPAYATVPWSPLVLCEGPSGEAVLDDFVFTYYGRPVFQQQFVIRDEGINQWLYSQGVVSREIAMNFPQELIVPLYRLSVDDDRPLPEMYQSTLGAFQYVLKVELPLLHFIVNSRQTGLEQARWTFRECFRKR